jgi:hypothetical protein
MIELPVAMYKNILLSSFFLIFHLLSPNASIDVEITSPREGQVVRGNVEIVGTATGTDFTTAELAYAYAGAEDPSWFVIGRITQPVSVSLLTAWDTTTISDGDYQLKLTVYYTNGSQSDFIVSQVLVRNYTSVDSSPTPQPTVQTATLAPTTKPITLAATPFPVNNAALSISTVKVSFKDGIILGIFCMVGLGIYTALHGWLRRR